MSQPRPTNVLVVGVGGQGVIMVSKILAQLCQTQGFEVKQSEVHGMAKRGGVVFSHVRFGEKVWSPTIPRGESDVLIALEWAEGLRWLEYLRPDRGVLIADTQQIVPPFACLDRKRGATLGYSRETPAEVLGRVASGFALDAARMAAELGNPRASNSVLLGVLSTALEFPVDDWRDTLARFVPPKTVDVNLQAFEQGRVWAVAARESPPAPTSLPAPPPAVAVEADVAIELEITEAWCKGCDICVKMCPERCLALNANQVVEVVDINACTGCHICEWLCPDFAIAVHKRAPELAQTERVEA
ncbi:MAG: 2-oxoacid:acceptor oxidoreductase family protein [Alphaproteobacteria bacterium]